MSGRRMARPRYGAENHATKLTDSDVWIVRRLHHHHGFTQTELGLLFGVSTKAVSKRVSR